MAICEQVRYDMPKDTYTWDSPIQKKDVIMINFEKNGIKKSTSGYTLAVINALKKEYEAVTTLGSIYLKHISNKYVELDEKRMSGMPVIKNTRIPVSLVVECLKQKITIEEICEDYYLDEKQVIESLNYVIDVLDKPFSEDEDDEFR